MGRRDRAPSQQTNGGYTLTSIYQTAHTASVKTTTPVQNQPLSALSLIGKLPFS